MGALMLIFALHTGGAETLALQFKSLQVCEAARSEVMQILADEGAQYVALACVAPVKVLGT